MNSESAYSQQGESDLQFSCARLHSKVLRFTGTTDSNDTGLRGFNEMAVARHLSNAPITEALIDFRTSATQSLTPERLDRLRAVVPNEYSTVEDIYRFEAAFDRTGRIQTAVPETQLGWMFRSADGRQVAQFRRDGFTFNRLRPYTRWEELLPQALELWQIFVSVFEPTEVARLGVRFINRLPKVEPPGSYGLSEPPRVPVELHWELRGFLNRLVVVQEGGLSATLTQAAEDPVNPDRPIVLLDVDAFYAESLGPNDSEIPQVLQSLREMKNRAFFASITEETARLYE